ncbi:Kinesin light chain 3 [Rhizophlyctis rosea]|nr:Kinesin light chain 3 [Rhizophlyctis rosea]
MEPNSAIASVPPTNTTDLPLLGVRVSFFETFIADCGGRAALAGLTTAEVCNNFVKPRTKETQSLCQSRITTTPSAVGQAKWFISHCWQYTFLDVVDAIMSFFETVATPRTLLSKTSEKNKYESTIPSVVDLPRDDPYVWFDLFSLPQHTRSTIAADWLQTTFMNAIATMGNVLMILTPWNDPITLTRAWCVFELYAAAITKSNFHISLPPSDNALFYKSMSHDTNVYYHATAALDAEQSKATEQDDLIAIQTAIRQSVGFAELNRIVLELLFNWMVEVLKEQIRASKEASDVEFYGKWLCTLATLYQDKGLYTKAGPLHEESYKVTSTHFGKDHPRSLSALTNLCACYDMQGEYALVEPHLENLVIISRRLLGHDDERTLARAHNLGGVYIGQGKGDLAEPLLKDCLARRERVLGKEHELTNATLAYLASAYVVQGRLAEAEPLRQACYERALEAFGERHPFTLHALSHLAALHGAKGDYEEAIRLYEECIVFSKEVLGVDHPATLATVENFGVMYEAAGNMEKAIGMYYYCFEQRVKKEEENQRSITRVAAKLANLLSTDPQRVEEAEELFLVCVKKGREIDGDDHPSTLFQMRSLGVVYMF